jgi:hypothetical protein
MRIADAEEEGPPGLIRLEDVSKRYPNGTAALQDVDLTIDQGDFAFLVGSSGAGKSTLIRLLIREELEVLEDDADGATEVRDLRAAEPRDVLVVDDDAAGRRDLVPDQEADDRGLAGAGRPDEERELPWVDGEVNVLQRRGPVGVALTDVLETDQLRRSLFPQRPGATFPCAPGTDRNGASGRSATAFGGAFVLSTPLCHWTVREADSRDGT